MSRRWLLLSAVLILPWPLLAARDAAPAVRQLSLTPVLLTHTPPKTAPDVKPLIQPFFSQVKSPAPAADEPYVRLPAQVTGDVGDFITVAAETNGAEVWWLVTDPALKMFPPQLLKDSKTVVVIGKRAGRYAVYAWTALGNKSHPAAVCSVVVGDVPIPPGPDPKPEPKPDPKPPDPPSPAPIPAEGMRVLIVYESATVTTMPVAQQNILYGKAIRDWMNAACVMGPDGKTKEWRIYDKDVAMSGESIIWQNAMKRPRSQVPWLLVSNGKTGWEGPLPQTVDDTLAILKKYGGN